ncbi:hypothetical protein Nepgr_030761 [Nepenthes gracilis]|uniref:Uncharacterized protein n=1 Tax=Nepenthes gracilis TaxID=150966 RepID=A0AAD3Y4J6_NEPGR|nr:hypothetical protein Nepgr_030761 [Nepenthes gracilis]
MARQNMQSKLPTMRQSNPVPTTTHHQNLQSRTSIAENQPLNNLPAISSEQSLQKGDNKGTNPIAEARIKCRQGNAPQ